MDDSLKRGLIERLLEQGVGFLVLACILAAVFFVVYRVVKNVLWPFITETVWPESMAKVDKTHKLVEESIRQREIERTTDEAERKQMADSHAADREAFRGAVEAIGGEITEMREDVRSATEEITVASGKLDGLAELVPLVTNLRAQVQEHDEAVSRALDDLVARAAKLEAERSGD